MIPPLLFCFSLMFALAGGVYVAASLWYAAQDRRRVRILAPPRPFPRMTIVANGYDARVIVSTPTGQMFSRRYLAAV